MEVESCPLGITDLGDGKRCLYVGCRNREYCRGQTDAWRMPYRGMYAAGMMRITVELESIVDEIESYYTPDDPHEGMYYDYETGEYEYEPGSGPDYGSIYQEQDDYIELYRWIELVKAYGWAEAKHLPYAYFCDVMIVFESTGDNQFAPPVMLKDGPTTEWRSHYYPKEGSNDEWNKESFPIWGEEDTDTEECCPFFVNFSPAENKIWCDRLSARLKLEKELADYDQLKTTKLEAPMKSNSSPEIYKVDLSFAKPEDKPVHWQGQSEILEVAINQYLNTTGQQSAPELGPLHVAAIKIYLSEHISAPAYRKQPLPAEALEDDMNVLYDAIAFVNQIRTRAELDELLEKLADIGIHPFDRREAADGAVA